MENKNFLNIKNKLDLIKKVEFMTSLGIYKSELMPSVMMENYVYGNNQIDSVSKQDIV